MKKFDFFGNTILFQNGSSTHSPDQKGGMTTCDLKMWVKVNNENWFRPKHQFSGIQCFELLKVCKNENQLFTVLKMLKSC